MVLVKWSTLETRVRSEPCLASGQAWLRDYPVANIRYQDALDSELAVAQMDQRLMSIPLLSAQFSVIAGAQAVMGRLGGVPHRQRLEHNPTHCPTTGTGEIDKFK